MKKLFLLGVLFLFVSSSFAQYFAVDGINYEITSNTEPFTVTVMSNWPGYEGDITIPDKVQYNSQIYEVSDIYAWAFHNCNNLTSINVSEANSHFASVDGVLYNKDKTALIRCPEVRNGQFVIPNSVTSIGDKAFKSSRLTSIIIPYSVTSIGGEAFEGCTGLTTIAIPNSVTSIGDRALGYCTGLTTIAIPNSVTSIGGGAFVGCTGLTSIAIPNSVTSIGDRAFWGCTGLTTIAIQNSVTSIGDEAFWGCAGLTSIEVSSNNKYYASKDGVLYNKDKTALIRCPEVRNGQFVIPNSVTSIENGAFSSCTGLTSILIPNSVSSIGNWALNDCTGLTSIKIPYSVTSIGDWAFSDCTGLTSIKIPYSVTSIGSLTFEGCKSLTSIEIPNSFTSIGDSACFSGCTGLTSIKIPNSVTSIGGQTFSGCTGLTSIEIPNSVTSIGSYAFSDCSGLTSIICNSAIPPKLDWEVFSGVPYFIPVYVPYNSVQLYKQADQWKDLNIKALLAPIIGSGENLVSGRVYQDANTNTVIEDNEHGLLEQKILILPDSVYALTDNVGNYTFRCDTGSYQIQLVLPENWRATTATQYDVEVRTADTSGFDFGMAAIREESRSEVSIASLDGGRCFEPAPVYLTYNNNGTSIESGWLKYYPDSQFGAILKSVPAYDSLSADSSIVFWKMSNVMPFEQKKIWMQMQMPDFTAMGDTLVSALAFEDKASVQYTDTSKLTVRCSYDPNDKQVNPAGVRDEHFVLMSDQLEFTIRFQNTGNDVANRVVILDTLSQHLDLATFEVIASSHSVKTNRSNKGVVEFRFDNIMLADSNSNEPASHGFVKYRIKAKIGLPDNTVVENTSYIYFDYNPAVVTNTTSITLTYKIPQLLTDLSNVRILPNPFSKTALLEFDNPNKDIFELQIADVLGKTQQAIKSTGNLIVIERGNMPEGLYFFTLRNTASGLVYNGNFVVE